MSSPLHMVPKLLVPARVSSDVLFVPRLGGQERVLLVLSFRADAVTV